MKQRSNSKQAHRRHEDWKHWRKMIYYVALNILLWTSAVLNLKGIML